MAGLAESPDGASPRLPEVLARRTVVAVACCSGIEVIVTHAAAAHTPAFQAALVKLQPRDQFVAQR